LLPAVLIASTLVVGAAVTALAATDSPPPPTTVSCGDGRDWVIVQPAGSWQSLASSPLPRSSSVKLIGCLDLSQLPDPSQPRDSRG
jgi:hypothetical protein